MQGLFVAKPLVVSVAGLAAAAGAVVTTIAIVGGSPAPAAGSPAPTVARAAAAGPPVAPSAVAAPTTTPSATDTNSVRPTSHPTVSAQTTPHQVTSQPSTQPPAVTTSRAAPRPVIKEVPSPVALIMRPGGRPGPNNTGVPPGTNLTVVNGDVTVTTNGAVIDAEDIKGALIIRASNVTVRRSLIEGSATSDSVVIDSGTGIVLEDDEVAVAHPTVSHDAMSVRNATLNRLNIHGGVDGMKLGSNSTVENSWIHSLNAFPSDPAQGGGPTHNDAIQIMSGTNIRITGNYLQVTASDNSAIQVTQDTGPVSGVTISGNWADGGGCTFNFSGHGPGGKHLAMSGITATDNRFGRDTRFANCPVLVDLKTTLTQSDNVYDAGGAPIAIQRHN